MNLLHSSNRISFFVQHFLIKSKERDKVVARASVASEKTSRMGGEGDSRAVCRKAEEPALTAICPFMHLNKRLIQMHSQLSSSKVSFQGTNFPELQGFKKQPCENRVFLTSVDFPQGDFCFHRVPPYLSYGNK